MGPGKCVALPADLQNVEDIKKLVQDLSKHESRESYFKKDPIGLCIITDHYLDLDVLINNAGATWGAPLDEYPEAAFQKVMNLNVNRVFALTQACLPLLRAKASQENPSRVINIGSINGVTVRYSLKTM